MHLDPEYRLSPRKRLRAGDAVKVYGRRGKFRFVGANAEAGVADVVGPIGGAEILRRVRTDQLHSAGSATRESVAMCFEALQLSRTAQSWKGRRR